MFVILQPYHAIPWQVYAYGRTITILNSIISKLPVTSKPNHFPLDMLFQSLTIGYLELLTSHTIVGFNCSCRQQLQFFSKCHSASISEKSYTYIYISVTHYLSKLILWWCCPPALPRPPGCFLCFPANTPQISLGHMTTTEKLPSRCQQLFHLTQHKLYSDNNWAEYETKQEKKRTICNPLSHVLMSS